MQLWMSQNQEQRFGGDLSLVLKKYSEKATINVKGKIEREMEHASRGIQEQNLCENTHQRSLLCSLLSFSSCIRALSVYFWAFSKYPACIECITVTWQKKPTTFVLQIILQSWNKLLQCSPCSRSLQINITSSTWKTKIGQSSKWYNMQHRECPCWHTTCAIKTGTFIFLITGHMALPNCPHWKSLFANDTINVQKTRKLCLY